jgi:hypothetical protein
MGSFRPSLVAPGRIVRFLLAFLLACVLISPALAGISADGTSVSGSSNPPAQDNPERIPALKTHEAFVDQLQDAHMAGVISYIDSISSGKGSGNLRNIRADYLATAASVPVMQSADDIAEAQAELLKQSSSFAEEAKTQIQIFNGSTDAMREQASASMQDMEDSVTNLKESLWLGRVSARLTVFNRESGLRSDVLQSLSTQGVNISKAANISQQIDAQRYDLVTALITKSPTGLKTINSRIKFLNRDFRTVVEDCQSSLHIEMSRAAMMAMK